jgi:hypothetical protein
MMQEKKPQSKPTVITICGSMRFYEIMLKLAGKLTENGNIVLMPFATKNGLNDDMLDRLHAAKIDLSDIVYIVAINQYIGFSTKKEIVYAKALGKQVMYIRNESDVK